MSVRTWRGGKPGERSTKSSSLRRLSDTARALLLHVDPVIDQNTAVSVAAGGARVPPPLRSADRAARGGAEVLSRHEAVNQNRPELKLFTVHTSAMQTGRLTVALSRDTHYHSLCLSSCGPH